ncbi:MAG: hypothetical protein WAQ75_11390, partial [Propionicimonas sp.]
MIRVGRSVRAGKRPGAGAPLQISGARRLYGDFAPALVDYTDHVLFGDVWLRPGLNPRDRSLVT